MGSVEEVCLVCADPLDWTAVGPCGHNLTCSQCVARLRFVLRDKRCTVCQQDVPQVLFTRYMGDYTARLTTDQQANLKARVASGDLYALPEVDGYFDDAQHYAEMKALVGYQHPILASVGDKKPPTFTSFPSMKKWIESNLKVSFCDLCVVGRKVFICEQLVYDKPALDKHNRVGDDTGPMAESGFKGHSPCNFCKKRFYDSSELYRHMESQHEHCFMCRREHPDKYVYYRHYQELQDHFNRDHHLCPHQSCIEKRFMVFGTEAELKRHFAVEHGDDTKMSRSARREALTIPVNVQYRRDADGAGASSAAEDQPTRPVDRPGTIIGGGHNVTSRHGTSRHGPRAGGRGGGAGGRGEAAVNTALQASLESLAVDNSLRESSSATGLAEVDGVDGTGDSVTFQADDFPIVGPGGMVAAGAFGRWTAGSGSGMGTALSKDDFPALPTMSKAARKKMGSKTRQTLAERLAAAAMPIRVINKQSGTGAGGGGTSGGPSGGGGGMGGTSLSRPSSSASLVQPASGIAASRSNTNLAAASVGMPASRSNTNLAGAAAPAGTPTVANGAPQPVASVTSSRAETAAAIVAAPGTVAARLAPPAPEPVPQADDFPSLAAFSRPAAAPPPPSAPGLPNFAAATQSSAQQALLQARFASTSAVAVASTGNASSSNAAASASSSLQRPSPEVSLTPDDFPTLGALAVMNASNNKAAAPSGPSTSKREQARGEQRPAATPAATTAVPPATTGGVSERLKAANRELVDKCKRRLTDEGFGAFRNESGRFMRGEIPADEFHNLMVEWGLLSLASELAVLCPRTDRRQELLDAHKAFLLSPAAQRMSAGWTPPEAGLAATARAEACPSWACPRCTLINAPSDTRCEACEGPRPKPSTGTAISGGTPSGLASSMPLASSSGSDPVLQASSFPSLPPSSASLSSAPPHAGDFAEYAANLVAQQEASTSSEGGKKGGKKGKGATTIRLGGPPPGSRMQGSPAAPRVHPQNVWTQPETVRKNLEAERQLQAQGQGQGNKGQWASGGGAKLARRHGAVNDAWGDC